MSSTPSDEARARAAEEIDRLALPTGAALVWRSYAEPSWLRTWDLYCLDDYDFVALLPPGTHVGDWYWVESTQFGCCDLTVVDLPNGWSIAVGYHS